MAGAGAEDAQEILIRQERSDANFYEYFRTLRDQQDTTDVILLCTGGQKLRAHKFVLGAASPYFRRIFEKQTTDPRVHRTVILNEINANIMSLVLDYLYFGEVDVPFSQTEVFGQTLINLEMDKY